MTGGGDRDERDVLRAGQVSKRLAQLRAILDLGTREFPDLREGFDALATVQRSAPDVVSELLSGPQVGAWAAWCLRRLGRGEHGGGTPLWVHLAHLGAIAAAAAMRSGVSVQVRVPCRAGIVAIPSVGRAHLQHYEDWSQVDCIAGPDGVTLDGTTPAEWAPVRVLRTEAGGVTLQVHIDEVDPYWRSFGIPVRDRLTDEEVARWGDCLAGAWRVLADRHPHRLVTMAAAIRCLVPVEQAGRLGRVSASSADAPGAIALTAPSNPTWLAATLVHESQHYRLSALHDLRPLYREPARDLLYSPWRNDSRPLSGVVHGTQAFLGVADFWLREGAGPVADLEYTRHVDQLRVAMDVITAAEGLTPFGRSLAASLRAAIDRLPASTGAPAVRRMAADLVAEHQANWRLRNVVPTDDDVRRWDDPGPGTGQVVAGEPSGDNPLTRLAMALLEDPEKVRASATDLAARFPGVEPVDLHLLDGDYTAAKRVALARIEDGTASHRDWAVLAVAHGRLCPDPSRSPLVRRPEVVMAAWRHMSMSLAEVLSRYEAGGSTSDSIRR